MEIAAINRDAHQYWKMTGYDSQNIDAVCALVDKEHMAARVTFRNSEVQVAITHRTWERQEGHYPAVARYFEEVARHEALREVNGSLIVWLEDGFWEYQQRFSVHAPILSFGRHRTDYRSFLIPDPAYMGSFGYRHEQEDLDKIRQQLPWQNKIQTAYWRGAATGLLIETEAWVDTARGQLTLFAAELDNPAVLDAKITKASHLSEDRQQEMLARGVMGEAVDFSEFLKYRYLIDADGYCCAWKSLVLKLASRSTVLKMHSDYEQWFYRDLLPWKHYIPVRPDLSDFMGIYTWLLENDTQALEISENGRQFIRNLTYDRSIDQTAKLCAGILACQRPEGHRSFSRSTAILS